MLQVLYSQKADADLEGIVAFTQERWGQGQAEKYLNGLVDTFYILAKRPSTGRVYSTRQPAWRRFEHVSHVILYQSIPEGIRIQRIIHKRQLVERASR